MDIGIAMTRADAERVLALLAEASPYCAACADLYHRIAQQLARLDGHALPPVPACPGCRQRPT